MNSSFTYICIQKISDDRIKLTTLSSKVITLLTRLHTLYKPLIISMFYKCIIGKVKKASEWIPMPLFVCMFSIFWRDENMLLDEVDAAL